MKQKKKIQPRLKTWLVILISILVITLLIGGLVFLAMDKQNKARLEKFENRKIETENNITRPKMPSFEEEANKYPKEIVIDFYNWYIASSNFRLNQIKNRQGAPILDLDSATKNSVFVSSEFSINIEKRKEMFNPILCTNDTENNYIKEYNELTISEDNAVIEVITGWHKIENNFTKIQVILKKEANIWKIADIICKN